jgi:hypothetical protein
VKYIYQIQVSAAGSQRTADEAAAHVVYVTQIGDAQIARAEQEGDAAVALAEDLGDAWIAFTGGMGGGGVALNAVNPVGGPVSTCFPDFVTTETAYFFDWAQDPVGIMVAERVNGVGWHCRMRCQSGATDSRSPVLFPPSLAL